MTKTVEEVRRELFEAKFPIPKGNDGNHLAAWIDDEKLYRVDVYPGEPYDDYGALWEGFNAALDLLVFRLPAAFDSPDSDGSHAWNAYEREMRAAIEQTGLGIKVK